MYQASLVHHAAVYHYRPGQEDTALRVLSSAGSDAGTYAVIDEPQADPAAYQVQSTGAAARLRGRLRPAAAVLSAATRRWAASSRRPASSVEARVSTAAHPSRR